MKQRVLISAALLHDPEVLAHPGKTILYISHVLEVVEKVCGQVVIIYKGKIRACDAEFRDLRQTARDIVNGPRLCDPKLYDARADELPPPPAARR